MKIQHHTTSNPEESPENYENSDQDEQTSIGDEESSNSSDMTRTIRIIGRS